MAFRPLFLPFAAYLRRRRKRGGAASGLRVLVAGLSLLAALSWPSDAPSAPAEINLNGDRAIELTTTKALYIGLPRDAHDVLIADPEVAEIIIKTPRRAYLIGQKPGDTNAFFLDKDGNRILTVDIRVEKDLTALRKALAELVPTGDIAVRAANGDIILSGEVPSAEIAEDARLLARRFVGDDSGVVSLLRTTRPHQVLIQVRVTEMQRSVAKRLGISLSAENGNLAVATAGASLVGNPFAATTISGSIGGFESLEAMITALEVDGYIKTLAEPNLTAMSGESASFLAGGEFPVPVGREEEKIQLEFKPFGVALNFSPVVLDSGRIVLRISTEVSSLSNEGAVELSGIRVPALAVRRAETTVEIPSGGSLVLGGLLSNDAASFMRGVPGLANLPVLGALFRSADFERSETELVVIAVPYLVRPTNPTALATPTDGFVVGSDADQFLFGKLYARFPGAFSSRTTPPAHIGFILD